MNKVKFLIAIFAGKISAFLLQKIFKRGTNTPGAIMLKIFPDALARFTMPEKIICVTGTNGKTGINLLNILFATVGKLLSTIQRLKYGPWPCFGSDCTRGKVLAR